MSPSSLQSLVAIPLLSLLAIVFLFSNSRNQLHTSVSSLASFVLYTTSSLLIIMLTQSWASPLLLSRNILALSIVGILLSSFALSFPLLYAHLSVLSILLSLSVESGTILVFTLSLLFLLTSFSTSFLLRSVLVDVKQPQWNSRIGCFSFSVIVVWILQCISFGRLFFFLSGHRYDFSTLQVPFSTISRS